MAEMYGLPYKGNSSSTLLLIKKWRKKRLKRLKTLKNNKNYLAGLNIFKGVVTNKGVADAFGMKYVPPYNAF